MSHLRLNEVSGRSFASSKLSLSTMSDTSGFAVSQYFLYGQTLELISKAPHQPADKTLAGVVVDIQEELAGHLKGHATQEG